MGSPDLILSNQVSLPDPILLAQASLPDPILSGLLLSDITPSDLPFLLGSIGIAFLLGLAALGSSYGLSQCGSSSIPCSSSPGVITYSYIAMIIISTIFFYAFILSMIIINGLSSNYSLIKSIKHLGTGLFFGIVSLIAGKSMGRISEHSFVSITKKKDFFVCYLISLASVEVILVISFLCSLLMIFSQ